MAMALKVEYINGHWALIVELNCLAMIKMHLLWPSHENDI